MATMTMARAGSAVRQPTTGVVMKGVFLHPDHFAGLEMATAPSSPVQAATAFTNPFAPVDALAQLDDLSISSPSSSSEPDSPMDYFSSRSLSYHRNSDSSFASESSYSSVDSSEVSTPTCESPHPKAPTLSRNNSSFGLYSESPACPSPQFPASFSFSTFAPSHSTPSSRPSSPPRGLPYARPAGGSSMQRAVSSPVETQRALDLRTRAMTAASDALHEQAGRVARSRSVVGLPGLGLGGVSMSRAQSSRSGASSPLVTPFEEGWGSALPPREYEAPPMIPFPYNVGVAAPNPNRLARSYSVAHIENQAPTSPSYPSAHRHSLPTSHLPVSAPPTPGSTAMAGRPRRGTLTLAPLTPIMPSSPLMSVEESHAMDSFAAAIESSPKKGRLTRGLTF